MVQTELAQLQEQVDDHTEDERARMVMLQAQVTGQSARATTESARLNGHLVDQFAVNTGNLDLFDSIQTNIGFPVGADGDDPNFESLYAGLQRVDKHPLRFYLTAWQTRSLA